MNTRQKRRDSTGIIAGDHQRLAAKLQGLHQQLSAAGLSAAEAERALSQTEAELEEHFTHEEAGGFFAEILEFAPMLEAPVRALLQQHRQLRELLRALRVTCRWACGESGARSGWLAEFAEFHRRFEEHERAENELMYIALHRDLGQGD